MSDAGEQHDLPEGEAGPVSLSFEQALAGLDDIVSRLEGGDVGLEEAVGLFAQGQRYLAACRERLDVAQARIDELTASDLSQTAPPDDTETAPF